MESKLLTISLSVIAGLISAPILYAIKRGISNYANREEIFIIGNRTWYEKFTDQNSGKTFLCTINLKQSGHSISGDLLKEVVDDKNDKKKLLLKGEFYHGFFFGTLRNKQDGKLNFAVFLLKISGDGDQLKGIDCWYENGEIQSSPVIWFDSSSLAESNFQNCITNASTGTAEATSVKVK